MSDVKRMATVKDAICRDHLTCFVVRFLPQTYCRKSIHWQGDTRKIGRLIALVYIYIYIIFVPMAHPIFPRVLVDFCNINMPLKPSFPTVYLQEISWPTRDAFMLCIDGTMSPPRIAIDFRRNVEEPSQVRGHDLHLEGFGGISWSFRMIQNQGDGWFVGNLYVETYYLLVSGTQLYLIYHYVFVPCRNHK